MIQPIKLSPLELDKLLDDLDAASSIPATNQRHHERVSCRCTGVIVVVDQDGYQSTFYIPLRDISTSGIAFLHRSMLHKGTHCTVRIRTRDSRWLQASGTIVRSRYIGNMVYEIGLKFDAEVPIDAPHLFTTKHQNQTPPAPPQRVVRPRRKA